MAGILFWTRFLPQTSPRHLRKLDCYANRRPLRSKTPCLGGQRLAIRKQRANELHQLIPARANFAEEAGDIHFVRRGGVTGPAHVAAPLLLLDEQAVGAGIERQAPAVFIGAFIALV